VGTYLWKDWVELPVLENYPVVRKVVQLDASTPLGMNLIVSAQQRPVRISKANYEEFTFFNLPAREEDPYSMPKLFDPRFILSAQVSGLQFAATRGPEPYWQEVVNKVYKGLYVDRLSATRAYREWSKALRSGLAGDPAAQAREIYLRLGERIRNLTQLGEHESAAMGRKEAGAACDPMNLDASVKSGETTGLGLHFLFFRLLVDQDHPQLFQQPDAAGVVRMDPGRDPGRTLPEDQVVAERLAGLEGEPPAPGGGMDRVGDLRPQGPPVFSGRRVLVQDHQESDRPVLPGIGDDPGSDSGGVEEVMDQFFLG